MNYSKSMGPDFAVAEIDDALKAELIADGARTGKRKKLFIGLAAGVAIVLGGYNGYEWLFASGHVETDNAYVGADVAQVTPQVSAPVAEVLVSDTQPVRRGDILVRLDDSDARLALATAEASVGLAIRKVRGIAATDDGLTAQIAARAADQARAAALAVSAQSDLAKAQIDLDRRGKLAASGSVSGDELTVARNALSTAQANVGAARAAQALADANRSSAVGTRNANSALISAGPIESNPEVAAAIAARDQARLDLSRTIIRAPIDGVISKRQVQVGQRVQAGTMLMTVVPLAHAYVDANFKEVQLAKVHPGQKVRLTSDLYGSDVVFHGTVTGFSGGTGAAFALIPAQNATGNWIKVVQRLPVRIALDPRDTASHPLRVGLSMNVDIDVAN